ncbi:hypothetical protein AVEN_108207-1 [Araneus ventricosus]|uniref:Pre-C2HC domain-containing protein n=1 Tax=Araneus ventricosus TaxID=182803 RepID=A0A4Y2I4F1_ARAVE|nr:hypothetical protein AVEN_108207-1 [Araneus ventricosus]
MIDVRENEMKVELLRIGPCKEIICTHHRFYEDRIETNQTQEKPFTVVPHYKAVKPKPPSNAHISFQTNNRFQNLIPDEPEIPAIILKIAENYNVLLQEITKKFPGTNNTLFRGSIKISANSTEDRNNIIKLLQDKNQEFIV